MKVKKEMKLMSQRMKWQCTGCGSIFSYEGDDISYKPTCLCEPKEVKTGIIDIDRISDKLKVMQYLHTLNNK